MYQLISFLGRRASYALPLSLVIGLAIPPLSHALNPFLAPAFALPLTLSITRLSWSAQIAMARRWKLMLMVSAWMLVACPAIVWLAFSSMPLPATLLIALVLGATAPPTTACGPMALFMRLDGAVAVVGTTLTLFLSPFTIPPLALYLLGIEVEISLLTFMARLGGIVFFAFGAAFIVKKVLGMERIDRHASFIDGISVISISIFVIGIMAGMTELALERPGFVLLVLLMSTILVFGLNALSALVFSPFLPRTTALSIGLICGQANFGLLYMVLADQLPLETLALFAIGQIPLYMLPAIETPIAARLIRAREKPAG